ncbi:MAG TPA: ABC transporter ATP-binding protein [Thermoplasmata archaeon]|nr:ABC transporter ATP-binding protein [Thermoplasmata archaeon]
MIGAASSGLRADRATVRYGARVAVRSVSLEVTAGELLALAGPNGSGKSTLLRAMVGLVPLADGTISYDGRTVGTQPLRERARAIGWMPQEEEAGENVSLEQYVEYGRYAHIPPFSVAGTKDRHAVASALTAVDLSRFSDRGMRELSGGERQRARLARVLAQESPVLLLDEATSHLDMGHQLDILARVRSIARQEGRAVVLALHDINLAARFADRVAVLSRGHLVATGPPSEVLSSELFAEVWGVVAQLRRDPTSGLPYLVPELPRAARPSRRPGRSAARVHVVGGGGSASAILRRLSDDGYEVSAGVLHLFDSDTVVADELRIPTALEAPFAPLGAESRRRNGELLDTADVIVVAPFPVGPSNLANLHDLLPRVRRTPVALVAPPSGIPWDYADGAGAAAREALLLAGAESLPGAEAVEGWVRGRLAATVPVDEVPTTGADR